MSISVEPGEIERHLLGRPFAYVISMSVDGVHVIAIQVELGDGHLDCSRVGRSTRRNISLNSSVTVVFPPARDCGDEDYANYSLVVDGVAIDDGGRVLVRIDSAVLHRPA